jgi:hypothetical protein
VTRNFFHVVQTPFGIRWPILNKPFDDHRFLGLEIVLEKRFLGKGLLPRYLFKIQLQNFKELAKAKLRKRFEMVTKTHPFETGLTYTGILRLVLFKTIAQTK